MSYPSEPGFYQIPAPEYHADCCPEPSLSNSIAQLLLSRSPRHAWLAHPRLNPLWRPVEATSEMDVGTAAHVRLFEPDRFSESVIVVDADNWRTNAAKDARKQAREDGKVALLTHQANQVAIMAQQARALMPKWFFEGQAEETGVWQEEGIWLRARFDLRSKTRILDYKTTENAEPNTFGRRLFNLGYDVQEAFYRRAVRKLTGEDVSFVFLVQETEAPHLCSLVALDRDAQALGDAKVESAIALWRRCIEAKEWPAYPREICYAQAPGWAGQQWEEAEALREVRTDLGDVA